VKVVGRAMSTIGDRMLIIQCDAAQLPPLYSEITDRKMQSVGKILDLFGNVKAPYAAVLCKGKCTVQPNEKLFTK
jgi:RNA-binding protein